MTDISIPLPLNRSSVINAREVIKPYVHVTPVFTSTFLSNLASSPQSPEALFETPFRGRVPAEPKIRFLFKCENFQVLLNSSHDLLGLIHDVAYRSF